MNHRLRPRLSSGRRQLAILGLLAMALIGTQLPGTAIGARQAPEGMLEFMWGMAGQESGWRYTARNSSSGAYGKYQIMPQNWPHWASQYIGDRWADQTPRNQELVARAKIAALHRWLGSWRRVAYWWLTGGTETDERRWTSYARGYVDNVMRLMKRAPKGGDPLPTGPAADGPAADRGDWRYIVHDAVLFDRLSGSERRRVDRVHDGEIVFVQGSRVSRRGVLWMRVSTATRDVGWVSIRRTVPARRPANASRYPRGEDPGDGRGGRDDRPRRPRPR